MKKFEARTKPKRERPNATKHDQRRQGSGTRRHDDRSGRHCALRSRKCGAPRPGRIAHEGGQRHEVMADRESAIGTKLHQSAPNRTGFYFSMERWQYKAEILKAETLKS